MYERKYFAKVSVTIDLCQRKIARENAPLGRLTINNELMYCSLSKTMENSNTHRFLHRIYNFSIFQIQIINPDEFLITLVYKLSISHT